MIRTTAAAALLAAGLCLLALAGFGSVLDGFSHTLHAPALLGARGLPGANAFNLLGFVLPGLLGVLVMIGVRGRLDDVHWTARIGSRLWLWSALAFAVQGLLPLDLADMDGSSSRLHASAWTVWWLAFVPGGLLLAWGLGPMPGWRALRLAAGASALLLPIFLLHAPLGLPVGISQRIALALWLASLLVAGYSSRRQQP